MPKVKHSETLYVRIKRIDGSITEPEVSYFKDAFPEDDILVQKEVLLEWEDDEEPAQDDKDIIIAEQKAIIENQGKLIEALSYNRFNSVTKGISVTI